MFHTSKRSLSRILLCGLSTISLIGCGKGSDGPELATVSGIVQLDGVALPNAKVVFQPTDSKGSPSQGTSDESGAFTLSFNRNNQGAIIGTHKVSVTTATLLTDETGKETTIEEILPAKYHSKTELTENVTAGKNEIKLLLESDKKTKRR